jgi:hypothetical protein
VFIWINTASERAIEALGGASMVMPTWPRWIVMRTNDDNDTTFRLLKKSGQLYKYDLVSTYPFADIYQLKDEYIPNVQTKPVLPKQR